MMRFCVITDGREPGDELKEALLQAAPDAEIVKTDSIEAAILKAGGEGSETILVLDESHLKDRAEPCRLKLKTEGAFECYIDGMPASFKYNKTRDMLEYLVSRNGEMASDKELLYFLWGQKYLEQPKSCKSYLRNIKVDLMRAFTSADCSDAIIKQKGRMGISAKDIEKFTAGR